MRFPCMSVKRVDQAESRNHLEPHHHKSQASCLPRYPDCLLSSGNGLSGRPLQPLHYLTIANDGCHRYLVEHCTSNLKEPVASTPELEAPFDVTVTVTSTALSARALSGTPTRTSTASMSPEFECLLLRETAETQLAVNHSE